MGVYSDGSYGVPSGLIYSFPVTCSGGEWKIVQGMIVVVLKGVNIYFVPLFAVVFFFLLDC